MTESFFTIATEKAGHFPVGHRFFYELIDFLNLILLCVGICKDEYKQQENKMKKKFFLISCFNSDICERRNYAD